MNVKIIEKGEIIGIYGRDGNIVPIPYAALERLVRRSVKRTYCPTSKGAISRAIATCSRMVISGKTLNKKAKISVPSVLKNLIITLEGVTSCEVTKTGMDHYLDLLEYLKNNGYNTQYDFLDAIDIKEA